MTLAVADCLEVTQVDTDQTLTLATYNGTTASLIDSNNTAVHAEAEYGKIGTDGTYHAPLFVPPSGLDTVTLTDSDGTPVARLLFQVNSDPNAVAPGTMSPGMPTSAPETDSSSTPPQSGPATSSNSQSSSGSSVDEPETADQTTNVTDDTPTTLNEVQPVSTVSTPLGLAYAVPVRAPVELGVEEPTISDQLVVLSPIPLQKGKKCGVFPKPPYAGNDCTAPGTKTVVGPVKKYRKGTAQSQTMSGGAFGFSGNITFMAQDAVAVQYTDVYYCKNGKWSFDHTTKCIQSGVYRYGFTPYSAGAIVGTGYSFDSPWDCKRI